MGNTMFYGLGDSSDEESDEHMDREEDDSDLEVTYHGVITQTKVVFPDNVIIHISSFLKGNRIAKFLLPISKKWKGLLDTDEQWESRFKMENNRKLLTPRHRRNEYSNYSYHIRPILKWKFPEKVHNDIFTPKGKYICGRLMHYGKCYYCFAKRKEHSILRIDSDETASRSGDLQPIAMCSICLKLYTVSNKDLRSKYVFESDEISNFKYYSFGGYSQKNYFFKDEIKDIISKEAVDDRKVKRSAKYKKSLSNIIEKSDSFYKDLYKDFNDKMIVDKNVKDEIAFLPTPSDFLTNEDIGSPSPSFGRYDARVKEKVKKRQKYIDDRMKDRKKSENQKNETKEFIRDTIEKEMKDATDEEKKKFGEKLYDDQSNIHRGYYYSSYMNLSNVVSLNESLKKEFEKKIKKEQWRLFIRKQLMSIIDANSDGMYCDYYDFPRLSREAVDKFVDEQEKFDFHSEEVFSNFSARAIGIIEREKKLESELKKWGYVYGKIMIPSYIRSYVMENAGKTFYEIVRLAVQDQLNAMRKKLGTKELVTEFNSIEINEDEKKKFFVNMKNDIVNDEEKLKKRHVDSISRKAYDNKTQLKIYNDFVAFKRKRSEAFKGDEWSDVENYVPSESDDDVGDDGDDEDSDGDVIMVKKKKKVNIRKKKSKKKGKGKKKKRGRKPPAKKRRKVKPKRKKKKQSSSSDDDN